MEDSVVAEEDPGCFVRVTGISRETTEDTLLNFFLNTRRSGGGEIKDSHLKLEEGVADITFMTSEVAERVVQKDNLVLDEAKLTTTLITDPKNLPTDKRSVHVSGISDRTTKDGLMTYMEVVSGEEVENLLFGDTCNAMVIFKDPPEFEKLSQKCSKKTLDGKHLKIEQANICDCIEITGLSPKTTKDAVLYYFENSRNGGGDVRELEYDKEANRAVVFFDDHLVVDKVMKQDHLIDGAHLTINRYYTFLGETYFTNPSGGKKDRVFEINPNNMLLIKEHFREQFDHLLQESRVKYTWEQGSGQIVLGCAEPKMDKKKWENSCDAVEAYINQIVTQNISISREIWEQMSDEAKEKCAVFEKQISIQHVFDFKTDKDSIVLRGKKTDVCNLAKQLQDLVSRVEEQIMIEKSKNAEKIKVSNVQMDLMSLSGFVDGLKTRHEGVEVTVISDANDQAIQLRGLEEEVNECTAFVWQTLSTFKDSEIKFSKSVVSILGSERGKAFIATSFKNNNIEAIISFDSSSDTQIMVTAVDRDHLNNAVELIKNAIAEESIHLDTEKKQLINCEKWKEFKHSVQQSMLLQVTEEPAASILLLGGIKAEVDKAKETVEKFFQNLILSRLTEFEKTKISKCTPITETQIELLNSSGFAEDLHARCKDLEVQFSKKDGTIKFRGPDAVVKEGILTILLTLSRVKEVDMELPKSIVGIVGSQAGKLFLATKFKKEHIDAVVDCDPSSDNQLVVTAIDRKDAKKAADLIKDVTSEQSIPLDDHQKQLVHSEKWKQLKDAMQQSMMLQVREDPAASTLWIAGIKEEVDKAKEKVDDFFEENIILGKVIDAEKGRLKFILKYKIHVIQSMEKSLTNQSVKIMKKTDEDDEVNALVVSGTRDGIQQAVPKVQKIIDEIKERKVDLDKPGMKKLFSQKKGFTLLSVIENEYDCIIERCTPSRDSVLQVYAASNRDLNKAESDILKLIKENSKTKEIENQVIAKLSDAQIVRVMTLEVTHDTKIQIDKRINRIVIRGVPEDVANATVAVFDILNERSEEEHSRRYAELLSKNIQWYYGDYDLMEPYDAETNAQIEHAYNGKKTAVLISVQVDNGFTRHKIDFNAMLEKNLDTGETTRVDRRDKNTVSVNTQFVQKTQSGFHLPAHWDPQPKGTDGKELDLHMVVLNPFFHKKEYNEVQTAIRKTVPGVNIIKIERVQNLSRYRAYVVEKQKMDDQNGSNEKKLFHGTAAATCQMINHQGFNRSFCGKNSAMLGKGVYFARDASFSARSTFSPPDHAGNSYMYMASVLVGEYTKGHHDMIAPPAKNPNNPTITYDTVVNDVSNPEIFVVFHDDQNYPDYLITFR